MRLLAHRIGTLLTVAGLLLLVWVAVVWRWQDPFTAAYTTWQQHRLERQYVRFAAGWEQHQAARHAAVRATPLTLAADAAALRRSAVPGQAIGRLEIPRLGLDIVLVDGTDENSLTRGPGVDRRDYLPGQHRLVYIAGHRTTYLAPFAHIETMRRGDLIRIEMPYGVFTYRVSRHEIVRADDLSVLRSSEHELLRLQACHPRFFATHRYIVDAPLVTAVPHAR